QASHSAWVVVSDANGNPVPGAEVVFSVDPGAAGVPGPNLVPADGIVKSCDPAAPSPPAWCDQAGRAQVEITSREPGSFQVDAKIGGQAAAGAPKPVSFAAGAPDSGKSAYTLNPDTAASAAVAVEATGEQADSYRLTAQIVSASGIAVPEASVRLVGLDRSKVAIAAGGLEGTTGQPGSANYGAYSWDLYSATAGSFTVTVQVQTAAGRWEDVKPAPATLRFKAGQPAAANSWLIQPDGSTPADGATGAEVKARVVDSGGNGVSGGEVVFSVPTGLVATVGGVRTTGGPAAPAAAPIVDGYAALTYSSTLAGVHQVSAKVLGNDISTVKNAVETATLATSGLVKLNFTAGPAASAKSVLTVPTAAGGATKVADGAQRHRAEVRARDAHGNPAPGAVVLFRYGPDDAHLTQSAEIADNLGLAAVEFDSPAVADFVVRAEVGGQPVDGSPASARFVAGPFDPAKTLASFAVQDTTALATGVHPLWARLKAQDATGNPIAGQTLGFKLTAGGDAPVFAPLQSGGRELTGKSGPDGYLTAEIVSEFDGVFPVVGLVGADQTGPKNVTFAADGAAPGKSWFTVVRDPANKGDPARADGRDSYRVTVNLRGAQGHPLNRVGALIKVTDPATGAVREAPVTSGPVAGQSGVAVFDLTSTKAGAFDVTVELGGDQIALGSAGGGDKTAPANFQPGPPDPATSALVGPDGGPAKADQAERQTVRAVVRDAQSNPVPGAAVSFAIPADVTALVGASTVAGPANVVVDADATGQARLVLVSGVKGAYPVAAALAGQPITGGGPVEAVFVNADLSPGRSVFSIPTASTPKTVRTEFHRPTVELLDASGNPYTDQSAPVTFRWRLVGASSWAGSETVNSTAGVAVWPDWTVSAAGLYEVEAAVPSGAVGSPLTARFVAGPAVPGASVFASSAGARVAADGKDAHFAEVTVLDAAVGGNPVPGQPVTFTVDGSATIVGAGGQSRTVDSSALGLARVQIVDAKPGGETVKVTAKLGGVTVGSAELEFGLGAPDAARSSWRVAPTTALAAAHPAVVADGIDSWEGVVTLRDAADRPVSGDDVSFEVPGDVSIVQPGPYQTNAAGQVTVTFATTRAGAYQVRALTGAVAIKPGPATIVFAAGPVAAGVAYLESPGVTAVADGKAEAVARAHVLDAHGNPVAGGEVRFDLPPGLAAAGPTDRPVDAAGVAELAVTATRAGTYKVSAAARGPGQTAWTPIERDAPAAVQFVAGPIAPARSAISASPAGPLQAGAPGATYQVRARLRDAAGNEVEQAGLPIQFRFFAGGDPAKGICAQTPDAATQFASALTGPDGVAEVPFASTEARHWRGCAYYAGRGLALGSPVDLVFEPGPVDPARSDFEVSQNLVLADGAASHYGRVVLRDRFGNPLGGRQVTLKIDQGAPNVPGPNVKGGTAASATVTTCDPDRQTGAPDWCRANGVFQTGLANVEFTSEEPGTFAVSAVSGGTGVDGSPKAVSFTAGPADPARSNWAISPNTADPAGGDGVWLPDSGQGGDAYELTLTARSSAGLPVPGARVRLAGLDPAVKVIGGTLDGTTGQPGAADFGRHVWRLASATPGQFTGRVQVLDDGAWVDVQAPFTVRFRSPGADAVGADSELTIPTAGEVKRVGGTDRHSARVVVRDAAGRPVAGVPVRFEWTTGTNAGPGPGLWTPVDAGRSGPDGGADFDFAAPDNRAGWVWVRAFIDVGGVRQAVGGPQREPVAAQTVKGARFEAGPPDAARTAAAFETFRPAVANDLTSRSWARVVVQDRYGNPVPGAKVVFALPPGAAAPVFADGSSPPTAKTVTVVSCADDLVEVPDRCRKDGVYTPGMAYAPIVSGFAGTFPVSGRVAAPGGDFAVGPGPVAFAAAARAPGGPSSRRGNRERGAGVAPADGVASYDLTVTAMSRTASGATQPAPGACVTPQLPRGLTALPGPAGACPAGSYETDQ
ncbi:MAG: Ig-like domain-containing protein, partial [Bifidobacteriaceae bacterium]|nr:Ig-like domain-containing protein [Bifidobacteriaceae bacterium]